MKELKMFLAALVLSVSAMAQESFPEAAMMCPEENPCSFCFFGNKEMLCWITPISLPEGTGDKTLPVSDPFTIDMSKTIKDF